MPGWLKPVLRAVRVVAIAYCLVVVLAMFFEESLIFIPSRYPEGDWKPVGVVFEDAQFAASDGVTLHGWYLPTPNARRQIVYCHGNGGNITHRLDVARRLQRHAGASVLLFDYRGYGKSQGSPTGAGVVLDGKAARAWLARRAGIAEGDVVVMGESLGGGVAVQLAAELPARALVLDSTFSSLTDVAASHYPFLPVRWLMRTRLDSAEAIHRYHGPLLAGHGKHDSIVPYRFGLRLFDAANQPKQFVELPGDHNDPRPISFYEAIGKFLDTHAGDAPLIAK